jgi:TldD protein
MNPIDRTNQIFFGNSDLDPNRLESVLKQTLKSVSDGELYFEYSLSEGLVLDDGQIKLASYDTDAGFGFRAVAGETTGFAHSSDMSEASIRRAGESVAAVTKGYGGHALIAPKGTNQKLYIDDNPMEGLSFETKVALLGEIDSYARAQSPKIHQVSASISASWKAIQIRRADGFVGADIRPLVRVNVSVTLKNGERMESGSSGFGGRSLYDQWITPEKWQSAVHEAIRIAEVNLDARPAPAGDYTVVLAAGWPGVMLHEAVGHGLEGDFNRKGLSTFSGRIGEQVASKGVTVVDDGTLPDRRGSITIDDEGTPSAYNVLIENGKLVGYMQDRQNAELMGVRPTGNGRRESYAHTPMPRMTNTYMLGGDKEPGEIIASVKNGLYMTNFGGGQVDITSGNFSFSCTEGYLIEDGKVTAPIKGATLIGNGPDAMTKISMLGNDMKLDEGVGTCGKAGQGVPVGIGQPTLKMDGITVGGTAL